MIKETITYVDYDGNERTEDFYFNLTKAELAEMNLTVKGGMEQMIKEIVAAKDTPSIIKLFKEILTKSYGKKSPDGRRMMKNEEILTDFVETEAYSQLYMKLATDEVYAQKFVNGVMPSDLAVAPTGPMPVQ